MSTVETIRFEQLVRIIKRISTEHKDCAQQIRRGSPDNHDASLMKFAHVRRVQLDAINLGRSRHAGGPVRVHFLASRRTLLMILDSVGEGQGLRAAVKEFADANRGNVDTLLKQIMEQDNGKA